MASGNTKRFTGLVARMGPQVAPLIIDPICMALCESSIGPHCAGLGEGYRVFGGPAGLVVGPGGRLQALHTAELLTDAEMHAAEDVIVDCIEVRAKTPGAPAAVQAVDQALTMVVLSERLAGDAAFARQLRRKLRL